MHKGNSSAKLNATQRMTILPLTQELALVRGPMACDDVELTHHEPGWPLQ
jgi:hypothetical protein